MKIQWVVLSTANDNTVVYGPWKNYEHAKAWFDIRCEQHPSCDHVLTGLYDPVTGIDQNR
jgi:hypothetical protein